MAILPVYALTVYDSDDATPLFDVSTDPAHARPYLKAPTGFPEQEVDFAKGAASIGQVNVQIVDVRQTATDQDTGYLTGQLADAGGNSQLNGHRALLTEDVGGGPVTVLDGVIRSVRLLDTFATYELELRDIRERERKTKAFETTDSPTILPRGILNGYGVTVNGVKYPVPATSPLTATYRSQTASSGYIDFTNANQTERVLTEPMREALGNVAPVEGELETLVYDHWKVLWRDKATGGAYTTVDQVAHRGANVTGRTPFTEGQGRIVWLVLNNFVSGAALPTNGQEIEVIVQYDGPPTSDWPHVIEDVTVGELLRNLYRGDHSVEDPRIRYDETALLDLKTPVRGRIEEPIEDLRAWAEEHAYPIALAAPTLDAAGEISPIRYVLPDASVSLVTLNDSNCADAGGGWSHSSENAVNVVQVTHQRDYRVRPESGERLAISDQIRKVEVTNEHRVQSSIDLLGEEPLEIKSDLLRSIGTADGEPLSGDVTDETGTQLARLIGRLASDRWVLGGQYFALKGNRGDSGVEGLKVGSWVSVGVSWMPDYVSGTRGANRLAQVVGRRNLNGAWCLLTLIDAGSDNAPLGQPTLGTITANADGVVSIPVTALATGSPDARVDFAVNATEPGPDSELWTFLDRADSIETLTTYPLPAGTTAWVRARSEAPGERPSAYTNAVSVAIPQTPRIFYLEVELDDFGVPTISWAPNQFCLGVEIAYEVHQSDTEPTFPNTVDVDASLETHTLTGVQVPGDSILSAQVTPYDGWTGTAVSGTAGPAIEDTSEPGVALAGVISVQATDELYSVGVSGGDQGWKRRLVMLLGPETRSVNITVNSYIETLGLDDPGWPSQLVSGWNYDLDVAPSTTVHHVLQDATGSADAIQVVRYDEGNLLPGGRTFTLTLTPYSKASGGGVAGSAVTLLTKDFDTYDTVGFRTTETMDRRVDNNDTPGLGGFDLDMDDTANGFAFEWTNNEGEAVDISQVRFYVKATGSPGGPDDLTADIYQDAAGLPGTFIAESVAVDPTTIGTTYEAVTFDFTTPVTVADGVTVHVGVVYASGDASNYLSVEADDAGAHAELNGSWAAGVADREPLWRLYIEDEVERFARRSIPGSTNVKSTLNPVTGELEFDLAESVGSRFLDRGGAVFNVMHPDFGAVGDGVADDTAAIKATIAQATAAIGWTGLDSGAVVLLPPGDYLVDEDIEIPIGVQLIGSGQWQTRIKWASASDATDAVITSNLNGQYHNNKLVHSCQLMDVRIDASGVASVGVHIRGWQEGCKMRGVTVASAVNVCYEFDSVDPLGTGAIGLIQNAVFEDLRAIAIAGSIGFRLRDFRRNDCRRWTVAAAGTPASPLTAGIELTNRCYMNTFTEMNIEDCTIGIDLNTDPAGGASDCDGNNFLGVTISATEVTPDDVTIGSDTGTMAVLVRAGCKYYNFLSLRQHTQYDWLLYDEEKDQQIVGDNNGGGTVTWRGFVFSASDTTFLSDDRQVFSGATVDAWTPSASAINADTTDFDVSATNNMQCDTLNNDITVHGLSGGVRGQRVAIIKGPAAGGNILKIAHNSGTGVEKIFTPDGRDIIMPGGEWGAVDVVFNGVTWRVVDSHAVTNNGTATLLNGTTTIAVTHGLGVTPDIQDISVTPIESWGAATKFWAHTPTATQFTIEVDQDPTQDVDFAWTASVQ